MVVLEIFYKGKNYNGSYEISKGIISVYCSFFHKSTQLGASAANPEFLAKMILREIINENNL